MGALSPERKTLGLRSNKRGARGGGEGLTEKEKNMGKADGEIRYKKDTSNFKKLEWKYSNEILVGLNWTFCVEAILLN